MTKNDGFENSPEGKLMAVIFGEQNQKAVDRCMEYVRKERAKRGLYHDTPDYKWHRRHVELCNRRALAEKYWPKLIKH